MPPTDLLDLVMVTQAAHRLGVSADTIRRLADSGELRCVRAGAVRLFRAADVDRFARTRPPRIQTGATR